MSTVLVDGIPASTVPVDDRGLAYGDGLFETLLVEAGRVQLLNRHLQRLQRGCVRLRLAHDSLLELLRQDIQQLQQAGHASGRQVLKIIVTRGSAGRGYAVDPSAPIRRIVRLMAAPEPVACYFNPGIQLQSCQTRLGLNPQLAGIKHLNRLEQVLARMELEPQVQEGILFDVEGFAIEGTASNLFVARGDQLFTPLLDRCGVAGIAREVIMQCARQQAIDIRESKLTQEDLERADALFITNSLIGAWPVAQYQQRAYDSVAWAERARDWLSTAEDLSL